MAAIVGDPLSIQVCGPRPTKPWIMSGPLRVLETPPKSGKDSFHD